MTEQIPYVERMRRSGMKMGNCALCHTFSDHLEFHHENYKPERGLYLCHSCHHKVHWYPYQLKEREKRKLLITRLQTPEGINEAEIERQMKLYRPPRKS